MKMNMIAMFVATCVAVLGSGGAWAEGIEAPSVVTERAAFWLDASDQETLMLGDECSVTGWVSKATIVSGTVPEVATVPADHLAPIYDMTTYGLPTVDFGTVTSLKDMVFPRKTGICAAFFVMKIAKSQDAFWLGDNSSWNFHRGTGGEYGNSNWARFQLVQKNGGEVNWRNDIMPDDRHYVFGIKTSEGIAACSLTQDRNIDSIPERNGGKQLSELILFTSEISSSDFDVITSYLMRKWGFAVPKITVRGSPRNVGCPTPGYGDCTNIEEGGVCEFSAPMSCFSDSRLLGADCLGWTFLDGDGKVLEGDGNTVTINFTGSARYGSLTWLWSDYYLQTPPALPGLPGKYRLVKYLEQDSGAYVDTGVFLTTNTTEVVLKVGAAESVEYDTDTKWIGVVEQPKGCAQFALGRYGNKWRIIGGVGDWQSPECFAETFGPLTVSIRGNEWTFINGPTHETVPYSSLFEGTENAVKSLYLFAVNNNGVPSSAPKTGARIYGLEVYEKGRLRA